MFYPIGVWMAKRTKFRVLVFGPGLARCPVVDHIFFARAYHQLIGEIFFFYA